MGDHAVIRNVDVFWSFRVGEGRGWGGGLWECGAEGFWAGLWGRGCVEWLGCIESTVNDMNRNKHLVLST